MDIFLMIMIVVFMIMFLSFVIAKIILIFCARKLFYVDYEQKHAGCDNMQSQVIRFVNPNVVINPSYSEQIKFLKQ